MEEGEYILTFHYTILLLTVNLDEALQVVRNGDIHAESHVREPRLRPALSSSFRICFGRATRDRL